MNASLPISGHFSTQNPAKAPLKVRSRNYKALTVWSVLTVSLAQSFSAPPVVHPASTSLLLFMAFHFFTLLRASSSKYLWSFPSLPIGLYFNATFSVRPSLSHFSETVTIIPSSTSRNPSWLYFSLEYLLLSHIHFFSNIHFIFLIYCLLLLSVSSMKAEVFNSPLNLQS